MAAASCSSLAPTELEREHVHKVYDLIAPHFSHTRHHPWPQVTTFLDALEPGAFVADVGCGNGKYLHVNPSLCMIGGDRSLPLMQTATASDCNLLGCDALKVPLRTGAFDAALSIAVLHHISTEERRVALISELARLVRVGGEVLIVAWAFEQDERSKRRFEQQDVMVEWKLQQKYAQEEEDNESGSHGRVDQEKRWVVYERYCHVYRGGELEALVEQVPGLALVSVEYSRSNWCLRLKRVAVQSGGMSAEGAGASSHSVEVSPSEDEQSGSELRADENDDDNNDPNDGSDTSRVVESATSYARECLKSESYTEASIALRSALEIAKPNSALFKLTMLHVAQLLKVTLQLQASIDCMLSIYHSMPPPFTHIDGICIIARLYEQLESTNTASFWWKKVATLSSSSVSDSPVSPNAVVWEALGDRLFEQDLSVLAADCYGRVFETSSGDLFAPSNRLRYRYLTALLAFVGPSGSTAHRNLCSSLAWSLAQCFRRQNGSHLSTCYGDPHFYRLRRAYLASFPAIYRVVFVWVDGPAGRIARWWRRRWARWYPPPIKATSASSAMQRTKRRTKKNNLRRSAASSPDHQPQAQSRPFLRRKVYAPPPVSPPRSRQLQERLRKKIHSKETGDGLVEPRVEDVANATNATQRNNDASSSEESQLRRAMTRKSNKSPRNASKRNDNKQATSSKRRASAARGHHDGDPTNEEAMKWASCSSLLDVYPLQVPNTEDFVAVCGREPGFADLNLDEVGEFARLAHYRARVLTDKHARVDSLAPDRVKPQWLQDIDKAVALVGTQQQRNLASGKVVADGDSITHLSEVHTRLVLLITALSRQYARDFGETSFTRRLRGLTRRVLEWKFSRISDVVAALHDAKAIATYEEKQRNLEFYHVHRDQGE